MRGASKLMVMASAEKSKKATTAAFKQPIVIDDDDDDDKDEEDDGNGEDEDEDEDERETTPKPRGKPTRK